MSSSDLLIFTLLLVRAWCFLDSFSFLENIIKIVVCDSDLMCVKFQKEIKWSKYNEY